MKIENKKELELVKCHFFGKLWFGRGRKVIESCLAT